MPISKKKNVKKLVLILVLPKHKTNIFVNTTVNVNKFYTCTCMSELPRAYTVELRCMHHFGSNILFDEQERVLVIYCHL